MQVWHLILFFASGLILGLVGPTVVLLLYHKYTRMMLNRLERMAMINEQTIISTIQDEVERRR